MSRTRINPIPNTIIQMDDYQGRVTAETDEEVVSRAVSLVRVAEQLPPSLVQERMRVLLDEMDRRECFTNPDLADWMFTLSALGHRSSHPALVEVARRTELRKSRAVRFDCPLCLRPRLQEGDTYCGSCSQFLYEALGTQGTFDAVFSHVTAVAPIVRAHGPLCYLCGDEPTDHAEHVYPIAKGGQHRLSNLGGACWRCNLSKGDRILEPTSDQIGQLAEQQAAIHSTLDAIDIDAFWTWYMIEHWEDSIVDAVNDLSDDYPDLDRDEVLTYIEQVSEDDREEMPHMPSDLEDLAIDEVLRRIAAVQ